MLEAEEKGAGIFEVLIMIVSSPCIGNKALYLGVWAYAGGLLALIARV